MRGTKNGGSDEQKENEKPAGKFFKLGKEIIKPYTGKKDLPEAEYDKKGNIIKIGEPRHFLIKANSKTWKLIRVYRGKGIKRSLVRALKPRRKVATAKSIEDAQILKQLKEMEFPGAF